MKRSAMAILLLVLLLVTTITIGCGKLNTETVSKTVDPSELQKVVIAQPGGSGESWLPVYIASYLGYFKENGLDVSFVNFAGGPLVITSLLAGDSQFALTGYEQVMKTNEKGKDTKMIVATSAKHPWAFIVSKDIETIADLKGKTISGGMDGSSPRGFVRAIVRHGGLDPNKDVQFISLPSGGEIGALGNGQISATFGGSNIKLDLQKRGYKVLVDLADSEQHQKVLEADNYPLFVIQVTEDYITKNPENVQKFTDGIVKAMNWVNNHSTEEIAKVVAPKFQNMDKDIIADIIEDTKKTLSSDGYFTQEGHDAAVRLSIDAGLIAKPLSMESVVDESFLKNAHAKLDEK
ncbi:ABC transporter substrate-binding protein [Desulfosporosinus sp. BICA1-9]|uniref:ABC transporter substrate-binding protein n=1 Tax=Desulfosporosinus sp. BICA1-9 TaxID=1531958 RepID=UPI00054B678D|nr:ABC transporter substrate-binding protein [Desulfosporosinus sp. BICA1-9]KJS46559.1 MAG: hypothetical protein VR66_24830 [Peptococcaceae bacterium BRH_c23]KJS86248.1 MAG: hypothetical protein JL57_16955 [Desulfosporosinus sp. BICA1-9]HBW34341.1 ABC transporter substrate-binding protein [Desulfosporosinus sp.]